MAKSKTHRRRRRHNPRHVARVHRRRRRSTINRRRRRTVMANPRRRHYRRRRTVNAHRRRYHRRYRRNPAIFGRSSGKDLLTMVGGGLVGVAATKYLPTLLPASITSGLGGGPLMSVLITGAGAFAASWIARMVMGKTGSGGEFADAVLFGGLMQTGSAALNAFAPPSIAGKLALSGVGDIVPGYYTVPQNPITSRAPIPITAGQGTGMGNLRRFGTFR